MAEFDITAVQLVPMNKCRHLFIVQANLANINTSVSTDQTDHILDKYALRTDVNKTMHLKIWRSGNDICFEQMGVDVSVPDRTYHEENKFNDNCGCIYLGYRMEDDDVVEGYLIVGTGDFRNLTSGIDMKYWLLPENEDTPIIVECTDNYKLWIHSNDPFR